MRKHLILNVLKTMMFMLCMTSAVTGHTAGAPSVLVVTFDVEPVVRPWEQAWIDAGYQVKAVQYYRQVDWELLRRFNLLVVMPPLNYNVTGQDRAPYVAQPEEVAALSALVGRFLEQGGGVFFYGNCANTTLPPCVETLLKPYGANVLFEKVTDPNQTYQQPGRARQSFSFTANVVPFPSTEGVRTIYYPTGFFMYGPMTSPLKLSADWQVLVKGSATARSLAATYKTVHWPAWETNNLGTYTSKPPLIACRQVGKGRLAVSGLSPYMSMIWTGHPFYEDICLSRGDGHTPSDLGKLQSQLFRWLTTPSVGSTVLGGYVNEKRPLEYNEAQQRPIAWTPEYGRGGPDPYLPGIIGARTALTGGSGTVADWAQAARQAGLSWLVFAEDFARLTPQTWEKFKQECAAACADDLVMAPGWEILDVRGNHWLQAGLAMGWFAPSILSADGKRIEDAQNGRFGIAQTFTAAIQIKQNPAPSWSYKEYDAFAVVTQDGNGKVTDESLPEYLYQQALGDGVRPLAVALLTSPAQLANQALYRNYVPFRTVAEVKSWLSANRPDLQKGFISNGPQVRRWEGINLTRTPLAWYVPGTERWRAELSVRSEGDLAEVAIYDGPELYARYLPKAKDISIVLDGLHDQQRHLVAVIKDQAGRQALTSELETCDMLNRRTMCSDRNNSINGSYQMDPVSGRPIWCRPGSMQDKGQAMGIAPAMPEDPWIFNPPGVDGGIGVASFDLVMQVNDASWERGGPWLARSSCPLASKHMLIQQWNIDHEYKKVNGEMVSRSMINRTPYLPFRKLENWSMWVREVAPVMAPHDLPLIVAEGRVHFNRDVTVTESAWMGQGVVFGCAAQSVSPGENDQLALRIDNDQVRTGSVAQGFGWEGEVKAGGYFASYPGPLVNSALMVLDDGYRMSVSARLPTWSRAYLGVGKTGTVFKTGTDLDMHFLAIVTGLGGPPDTEQVEWVRRSMGLAGPPAYTVKATQGQVKGTKFFLELDAQDGGFTGVISQAKLPLTRLPIRIYGLNPHWSAAVYDRKRRELIPFGFTDGVGYASVDTRRGDSDVYIGSLATCDSPELRLWVVEESPTIVTIIAHNPTDKPITATVKRGAGYERVPVFQKLITVPAGSSLSWTAGDDKMHHP